MASPYGTSSTPAIGLAVNIQSGVLLKPLIRTVMASHRSPDSGAGRQDGENRMKKLIVAAALAVSCPGPALAQSQPTPDLVKPGQDFRTRLILLGTAGGPTWYGPGSPYGISSAVVVDGHAYIVDFGSGAFRQLRAAGIKPGAEKALFLTHLHSDHLIDLATLLLYDPSARRRAKASLQIFGPGPRGALPPLAKNVSEDVVINRSNPMPGTRATVDALVGAFASDLNIRVRHEGLPDVRSFFEAHDIRLPESVSIDANAGDWPRMEPFEVWKDERVRVTATIVSHGLVFPNFAYRFETSDGSIVFSGDTAVSQNLIQLATGADVLVHEAIDPTWIAEIVGAKPWNARQEALAHQLQHTHVTPEEAGAVAAKAGVKTLVLSHLVPGNTPRERWQAAGNTFKGRLIVGADMNVIGVGRPR